MKFHCLLPAAARTPGVPGVASRAQPEDDRGEKAGAVTGGRLQRGGGPEGLEVSVRASQSSGREGEGEAEGGSGASGRAGGRAAVVFSRGEFTLFSRSIASFIHVSVVLIIPD